MDFRSWAVIIVVTLLSISGIAESGSEAASVATIGMACSNNGDCSGVAHSYCLITRPCTKGRCYCSEGYTGSFGDSTCTVAEEDEEKEHGQACGESDTCQATTTCQDGTCQCRTEGHTYRSAISQCTDKKLFQESCESKSDCHANMGGNAACNSGVCSCTSGYIACTMTQMCRAPVRDEICESTPACGLNVLTAYILSGESSSVAPTCNSTGYCACAADESTVDGEFMGSCYKLCLSAYEGTLKTVGTECANFNECESKVCYQCPEDATPVCHNAECTSHLSKATPMTVGTMATAGLTMVVMMFL